ncbi:MAG: alanine dehydrogenase, partial [Chitinophagaceae bacterium]
MIILGLIREDKVPADNRVALTPSQCKWLQNQFSDIKIVVQSSFNRCYSNKEYQMAGVTISDDIQGCDILLGIKEVPAEKLLENKTYLFFSHTKKLQPNNQKMFQTIIQKKSTLIDYECMEHEDGTRII